MQYVAQFLDGYIWQRQPFSLHTFPGPQSPPWLQKPRTSPATNDIEAIFTAAAFAAPPPADASFLWGSVNFGDNIEGEWFITWLLLELTRNFPVTARIWDNDGEFILIEAAYVLPRWLKPELAINRVWLHNGSVHLVPLPGKESTNYPTEWGKDELTAAHGLHAVQNFSAITAAAGKAINDALEPRVGQYPEKARELMHSAVALVPARVAHVLCKLPQSVAAAVESFYFRDPYDARAARKMTYFPPDDLVRTSVRFSRCLYAQIALQDFAPSKTWPALPMPSDPNYPAALLGVKLAAGYEMLLSKGANAADDGYQHHGTVVPDVLEALKEKIDVETLQTASEKCPPSDPDSWLQEAPLMMETELQRREKEVETHENQKQNRSSKKGAQQPQHDDVDFDPSQLSSKMKEFMDASAQWEGAQVPENDYDDEDDGTGGDGDNKRLVDFDETKFIAEIQRIFGAGVGESGKIPTLGNHSGATGGGVRGYDDSDDSDGTSEEGSSFYSDGEGDDNDDEEEEGEGRDTMNTIWETATATDSDDENFAAAAATAATAADFRESYDAVLAQQLKYTSLAHTFTTAEAVLNASGTNRTAAGGDEKEEEAASGQQGNMKNNEEEDVSLLPVDVDANLVASLLASYQEQAGLPGPASNLAGLFGIQLPDPKMTE